MTRIKTIDPPGYPFLFSPFDLGPFTLKNRLVALPVHTGYACPDGRASDWMIKFYGRLAGSGAAMVVVANTAVSDDGRVSRFNLRADKDRFIPGLAQLAEAIKSKGSLACLQLNHAGRFAKTDLPLLPSPIISTNLTFNVESLKEFMEFFPFEKRFGLTRDLFSLVKTWGRSMTEKDRERVIQDFGDAAHRAWQAGFDMVELHGANGYLLCQFLSNFTNKLTKEYGGDIDLRSTFPLAVFKTIRNRVPNDFPIGYRLVLREWVPLGINPEQATVFAKHLEKKGAAYISTSAASYNSLFSPDVAKKMAARAYLQKDTAQLKSQINTPVIISGRITTPSCAESLIKNEAADLVGLGRPLRADTQWLKKAVTPEKRLIPCINCNACLKQVVLEQGFTCTQWTRWEKMRTRLEHKLLTRNTRALWVISDLKDIDVFKFFFPLLAQGKRNQPGSTLLILKESSGPSDIEPSKEDILNQLGVHALSHQDKMKVSTAFLPENAWESAILKQIEDGGHSRIFLAANPAHPWRARMLYKLQGKMTALLNTGSVRKRILVLVDLSETTLLVLCFLKQTLMAQPDFSFDFLHVKQDKANQEHSWKEAKHIAGLDSKIPLTVIRSNKDVVSAVMPIIQKGQYGTIVMGKRGLSGIKRWLMGSVSSGVLNNLTDQSVFFID